MGETLNASLSVLVADDMMTMRKLIRKEMSKLEVTKVVEAADGQEAWEKISVALENKTPFDIIICDWKMPSMLGIDLLKRVRQYEKMRKTPFIMITAESEKEDIIEAVQAGVSGVVLKPFTGGTIREKVMAAWRAVHPNAA